jgi:predicted transcriptional regulator
VGLFANKGITVPDKSPGVGRHIIHMTGADPDNKPLDDEWYSASTHENRRLHKYIYNGMGTNMRTTIDISDSLLQEAKELAARRNITLRALFEQGLREMVSKQKAAQKFTLRKAAFKGKGLKDEFRGEGWQKIRAAAYEGHGE